MRLECLSGCRDDIFADIEGVLGIYFDGKGQIFVFGFFDHAWDTDKIYLFRKRKATGNRRPGKNKNIGSGSNQLRGDGHGSADVSKTIGVMGIHQYVVCRISSHANQSLSTCWISLPPDRDPTD
jgi:hypothetical protein